MPKSDAPVKAFPKKNMLESATMQHTVRAGAGAISTKRANKKK